MEQIPTRVCKLCGETKIVHEFKKNDKKCRVCDEKTRNLTLLETIIKNQPDSISFATKKKRFY